MFVALSAVLLSAVLAGCGGGPPAPQQGVAHAPVNPPRFGDNDPHPWSGRAPQDYAVHGIDVSKYQPPIDWRAAREAGVSFAFVKATEGGDRVDPALDAHWNGARAAGIPVGAYHFFYHCRPAAEQADWFIRNVPKGALPPVLDMEWTPFSPTCTIRRSGEVIRAEAKVFLDKVMAHYGQRPVIYTTPDFFRDTELWRVGNYPFWLRSVAGHPQDVYAGRHWSFWQYTSTGLIPGIAGEVDINVFAGDKAQWQAFVGR
ncbi:MAG: GH25 family lysozyme [Paracoccaceae bacterium]